MGGGGMYSTTAESPARDDLLRIAPAGEARCYSELWRPCFDRIPAGATARLGVSEGEGRDQQADQIPAFLSGPALALTKRARKIGKVTLTIGSPRPLSNPPSSPSVYGQQHIAPPGVMQVRDPGDQLQADRDEWFRVAMLATHPIQDRRGPVHRRRELASAGIPAPASVHDRCGRVTPNRG